MYIHVCTCHIRAHVCAYPHTSVHVTHACPCAYTSPVCACPHTEGREEVSEPAGPVPGRPWLTAERQEAGGAAAARNCRAAFPFRRPCGAAPPPHAGGAEALSGPFLQSHQERRCAAGAAAWPSGPRPGAEGRWAWARGGADSRRRAHLGGMSRLRPDQESLAARASGQHPPRDLAQAAASWAYGGSGDPPGQGGARCPWEGAGLPLRPTAHPPAHPAGRHNGLRIPGKPRVCTRTSCLGGGKRVGRTGQGPTSGSGSPGRSTRAPTRPQEPALQPGGRGARPSSSRPTRTPGSSAPTEAAAFTQRPEVRAGTPWGWAWRPLSRTTETSRNNSQDSSSSPG